MQTLSAKDAKYGFGRLIVLAGGNAEGGVGATGLGLAVCKGLVEAHGGRIRAESPGLGRDARFTLTLPVAESGGVLQWP